jgi:hypothetical protein
MEELKTPPDLRGGGVSALVDSVCVMQGGRPVDADPDEEVVREDRRFESLGVVYGSSRSRLDPPDATTTASSSKKSDKTIRGEDDAMVPNNMDVLVWLRKHRDTEASAQRSDEIGTPNAAGSSRASWPGSSPPRSRR